LAEFTDGGGNTLLVEVLLAAAHEGYGYFIAGNDVNKNVAGLGGLLLGGGGGGAAPAPSATNPTVLGNAYQWFDQQANGGDIVLIRCGGTAAEDQADCTYFAQTLGVNVNSVIMFDFNVNQGALVQAALDATRDDGTNPQGPGREFLDRLKGAEAVYFEGGDQWKYVELLNLMTNNNTVLGAPTAAAGVLSAGNNAGTLTIGGSSAGLAILGNYVFTAQYIQAPHAKLLSSDILSNYYTTKFIQNQTPSIASNVLSLNLLSGVLIETHFTDLNEDPATRLGRFLSFMGSVVLSAPDGLGQTSVEGLAVDQKTAVTVTKAGGATVFGTGHAYFASTSSTDVSLNVTQAGVQAQLAISEVYIRWYGAGDGTFSLNIAWNVAQDEEPYAIYSLQGGSPVLTGGVMPPPPT
jgi:cyanophycinase-like exopeptidase